MSWKIKRNTNSTTLRASSGKSNAKPSHKPFKLHLKNPLPNHTKDTSSFIWRIKLKIKNIDKHFELHLAKTKCIKKIKTLKKQIEFHLGIPCKTKMQKRGKQLELPQQFQCKTAQKTLRISYEESLAKPRRNNLSASSEQSLVDNSSSLIWNIKCKAK